MASSLAHRWTILDKALQRWRYCRVLPLVPEGAVVVDLGCGDGDFLRTISPKILTGIGFDCTLTSNAGMKNLELLLLPHDNTIPLIDQSVDVVTALAVLEHVHDPRHFVAEAHRILRRGGLCIMTTPSPRSKPLLEFLAYRLKIISEADIRDHKQYFQRNELLDLFRSFQKVTVDSFQFGLNSRIVGVK
jgi:2-polyprenyl-3-methyl-5-hydroxy-6-metoxy-1,4-benzoquinol methylase